MRTESIVANQRPEGLALAGVCSLLPAKELGGAINEANTVISGSRSYRSFGRGKPGMAFGRAAFYAVKGARGTRGLRARLLKQNKSDAREIED